MEFDPNKSVTLEEYNQSLRDTVNAYYGHAMNDPSMSKDEAIQSTSEVSERYLGAVQEFQEAQESAALQETAENVSLEDAGSVDPDGDGIDNGMDI